RRRQTWAMGWRRPAGAWMGVYATRAPASRRSATVMRPRRLPTGTPSPTARAIVASPSDSGAGGIQARPTLAAPAPAHASGTSTARARAHGQLRALRTVGVRARTAANALATSALRGRRPISGSATFRAPKIEMTKKRLAAHG